MVGDAKQDDFLSQLQEIGDVLKSYALTHNVQIYPKIMQKSIQPLVSHGMVPCTYGGGISCVMQGGDGSSHHVAGFAHPFPHISELGGRPEASTKYPYKSKVEEYLATGKNSVVESIEMPRVDVVLSPSNTLSALGTDYITDYSSLQLPSNRGTRQFMHGQPVKTSMGSGTFWGVNTTNQAFMFFPGVGTQAVNVSHLTPLEPIGPQFGPWAGLPSNAVVRCPDSFVAVMEKALTDSPYVPSSGYDYKHAHYVQGLLNSGWFVFVVGGAVRDALRGVVSKDVDIVTDAPFKNMEAVIAHEVGGYQSNYFPYGALIQMGSDKQRALDVTCLRAGNVWFTESQIVAGSIRRDTIYRDFSCNALYYDPLNKTLVDPTGRGILDSVNRVLYPSCPLDETTEWLRNPRLGLRFFKMLFKGYQPSPEILKVLTPAAIMQQCDMEANHRGSSYLSKTGHWLLYRQLCGDLYYGVGTSYGDSTVAVKKQYKARMAKLKKVVQETGYEAVWKKYVLPMLTKHIDIE